MTVIPFFCLFVSVFGAKALGQVHIIRTYMAMYNWENYNVVKAEHVEKILLLLILRKEL